eukprot:gene2054-2375_t
MAVRGESCHVSKAVVQARWEICGPWVIEVDAVAVDMVEVEVMEVAGVKAAMEVDVVVDVDMAEVSRAFVSLRRNKGPPCRLALSSGALSQAHDLQA